MHADLIKLCLWKRLLIPFVYKHCTPEYRFTSLTSPPSRHSSAAIWSLRVWLDAYKRGYYPSAIAFNKRIGKVKRRITHSGPQRWKSGVITTCAEMGENCISRKQSRARARSSSLSAPTDARYNFFQFWLSLNCCFLSAYHKVTWVWKTSSQLILSRLQLWHFWRLRLMELASQRTQSGWACTSERSEFIKIIYEVLTHNELRVKWFRCFVFSDRCLKLLTIFIKT